MVRTIRQFWLISQLTRFVITVKLFLFLQFPLAFVIRHGVAILAGEFIK